jgi:hypothetical protein
MKNFTVLIFITLMTFCLVACDPERFHFSHDELKEEIIEVELINYDNINPKIINEESSEILPFDFDKMESVESLGFESIDDFLQDLSKIEFHVNLKHSDSPVGISIRAIYSNGDFIIISCESINKTGYSFAGLFDSEGNVKDFFGDFTNRRNFVDLVNKYFTTKID